MPIESTPQDIAAEVLTDAIGAGGAFETNTLRLFKNALVPTPDTVLADIEEADFDGYAAVAGIAFGAVFHEDSQTVQSVGAKAQWVATGGTTPNNVFGWYLTNAAGTVLRWVHAFDAPIPIAEAGNGLAVTPVLQLPSNLSAQS